MVIGQRPIGLLAMAVAKALGASPVILTGTSNGRLAIGRGLGADRVQDAIKGVVTTRQAETIANAAAE